MSQPSSELEGLPSWKLRLLERIQDTSADHARVLLQGYPTYEPHHGSGEIPMQTCRTHLRALESDRTDIETHAAAVGLPASAIDQARAAGQRGLRWADSVHSARIMRHGEDLDRAHMVEGVAADVWQLEHTAAINAERRFGRAPSRIRHRSEAEEVEQFGRNMAALRNRARDTAHVIGLSSEERAQLWGRDRKGWQRLVELAIATYDDAGLQERWRAYAWRGIEHEVRLCIDSLAAGRVNPDEPGVAPPTPYVLIERATDAVIAAGRGETKADQVIGEAIGIAPPHDLGPIWDSEPVTAPDARPPQPGSSAGYEL